jgi:hypothetical protein
VTFFAAAAFFGAGRVDAARKPAPPVRYTPCSVTFSASPGKTNPTEKPADMRPSTRGNADVKIMGLDTDFTQYVMCEPEEAVEASTLTAYMVEATASPGASPVLAKTA